MKCIIYRLLFIITFFINAAAVAQGRYNITGTIADEKGAPVKSATVFISGSEKITVTNDQGQFIFYNIDPGTFQLSVQMLGYFPYTNNLIIQDKSVDVKVSLKVKSIVLHTVTIGEADAWQKHYEIFKEQFLGTSKNAQQCVILNPQVIYFSTKKTVRDNIVLNADADEFLIIENKQLGYRIRYLLKTFHYDGFTKIPSYDGDVIFEDLPGTDEAKKQWAKNQQEAYYGSFMHFLRSVYTNTALKEGFITHQAYKQKTWGDGTIKIDPRPVKFDTVVTVIDTSFISLKFTSFYVVYDPKKAAEISTQNIKPAEKTIPQTSNSSQLILHLPEAIVDGKGSYTDYRAFLLKGGHWSASRIGDRLPFEYQPPDKAD
jgi:hypothetical protein